jgi:SAM-dependent methyltransferase
MSKGVKIMPVCRICSNKQDNLRFEVREMMYGSREKFEYFQCASCGCLQIEEVPADMGKYYQSGYYSYIGNRVVSTLERKLLNLRNKFAVFDEGIVGRLLHRYRPNDRLRALSRLALQRDQRVLDVGCGSGALLQSLLAIGFKNLLGIDPFIDKDIDHGNGLRVEKKELIDVQGKWDVVMFHHSLEHILNQLETLQEVHGILDDKGTCLIRIPTVSSFAWRHYGVNWAQLDAPRHLFLHSIESMALLANRAGFYIEGIFR